MKGWKTWSAAGFIGGSAILRYFERDDLAELLLVVGGALGVVGLGHKIEKKVKE